MKKEQISFQEFRAENKIFNEKLKAAEMACQQIRNQVPTPPERPRIEHRTSDNKHNLLVYLNSSDYDNIIIRIDSNKGGNGKKEDWYHSSEIQLPIKYIGELEKLLDYFKEGEKQWT